MQKSFSKRMRRYVYKVCVNGLAPRKNYSTCRRNRRVEEVDEGYMSCRRCLENMRLYREIHKDKRMEQNKIIARGTGKKNSCIVLWWFIVMFVISEM